MGEVLYNFVNFSKHDIIFIEQNITEYWRQFVTYARKIYTNR